MEEQNVPLSVLSNLSNMLVSLILQWNDERPHVQSCMWTCWLQRVCVEPRHPIFINCGGPKTPAHGAALMHHAQTCLAVHEQAEICHGTRKKKSSHDGEATGQYFMKMKYTGTVYTIPGERGCWRGVMRMRSSYGACGLFLNLKCVSQGGCRRATFGVGYVLTRELGALDSGFTFDRLVMTGSTVQFVTNSPQGFWKEQHI